MKRIIFLGLYPMILLLSGEALGQKSRDLLSRKVAETPRTQKSKPREVPFVFVKGDVKNSGYLPWQKALTLYDAVIAAGGLTSAAWTIHIKPTRPLADGTFPKTRRFLASELKSDERVQRHALRIVI
jgi:protein involved in polysaccharide export with SLBB domain